MPVTTAVIGRQPIVDREQAIIGYELLFRALEGSVSAQESLASDVPDDIRAVAADPDAMSAHVIVNTMRLGLDRVIGSKLAFCNADRGVLSGRVQIDLPPDRTVVEVLEGVNVDDEILDGCRQLRNHGYRLAADDFRWFPGAERLLEMVDIVKIDLRQTPDREVPHLMDKCRPFGVQLLAEKVETAQELALCTDRGFDLFQGYLLGRPNTIASPVLGPSRQGVLRMAAALLSEDTDFDRLERILRGEPALTYRLLQLASIGRLGETRREVHSIREALVAVGLIRIRGWLPALLLCPAGPTIDSSLPSVLSRARMAELLAERLYAAQSGFAFTAAMLSAFDLLTGASQQTLSESLEVPHDLRDAAFGGTSGIGRLVSAVIDYEVEGTEPMDLPGITSSDMAWAAARAFSWAMHMTQVLGETSR